MSNVVDLLTSLLEQVTPSKNHTSDQWSNLISELKNNLKESRASITNATDPLTESLSTILSALQSSRSSGSSESSTDENKPEASQSRQEYIKKTKTTHKSEGEQSGSAGKEREHLPESELHNTQKRKYSLTSVFKTFFGKGKIGESRDGDHSNEDTSASEGAGKIIMGLERKTKPLKKAMKRLRTSSLSNYTKELYPFGSLNLPKRGEADVPWEYRDENAMEEVSGRVPPLNFKLLMPHEHVTTPESSVNSPGSSFKKAKTETAADKEFDIAKIISAISSRGHSNVVEDEDDNKIGTEGTSGIDDAIEVDYNVAGTEGSMLLYENNREVGEGVSAEGVVGAIEGVGVAPDSVALSTTDVAKKHVPEVVGDGVAAGTSGGEGASVGDGGSGAQKDGDGDRYGLIVGVGDRGVVALNEGSTGTTAIAETVATNLPGLEIKYDSKVEATPAGTASGGPVADAKRQREFKECPREFINKMRESKEHVYTPLKEINNSTNKVNLYLVATEMIKSKLFIFKRKMYVFNYNAVDPSVYFNQSYVNPEVDYSIQILAPIDGVHHHINFGDILRLKRVDAHVKHEKGKKYVNILIPDKCNPTVRASVTLVGARPMGEVADNAEVAEGNETLSVGGESHTSCSDDVVLVEERLVIDGNMANVRRRSGDRREFEDNYVGNSSNTNEYSDANTTSSIREDSGSGDITGTSDGITDNTGANSGDLGTSEVSVDGTDSATTAITTTANAAAPTNTANTGGSSTGSTTSVNTCSTTEVTHAGAKDVDSDNFELWKRNAITVIGSDKLSYTMKDYNILMYMKEYAKRLDPVKVFRRPDLLRKLSEANSENLDFIVKVHNVSKDYTFIVSDATAKALVVELDPMLIENVFRSYNPVKKGDWIKLRSFYKAEGCSSLTLRPSSFACITRLPPMSQKVVGDEQARSSEKNVNRANSSKVNGLSGSKKENGRTRTVNLEVWTRTSCLNNSFPKRIKKSQSFIEKLLSTQHTVTFQKASPEPEKVEKEEGEISQ
ncbi:conserved hypothetical protein [Theileria orientalis strain Shintoku]|uniref:Uncharacterized protein n=1 Tax=Theileria orientalis strain Shintoku TaxID=869250 RepID=J4DNJ1_THEOR|nr:conserved hypothetical protein [Theileria orientalis strain Shintoku]BAM39049.1 conserved hypothetical protein [Theileria orientalis strain Shintoku]|eukprot:XP_009689350.1 conserved hypothetical protein [Theileria orientalis strain Shintoku]